MNELEQRANRNAAIRWGGFVVGLLTLQVAGGAAAIYLATGDPSVAVVPDYHQKALDWDKQVELEQTSRELGWLIDVQVNKPTAGLQIKLTDEGSEIEIDHGTVQLYHHARAGDVRRLHYPSESTGSIVFPASFDREGIWQVELDVTDIMGNRFVHSQDIVFSRSDTGAH